MSDTTPRGEALERRIALSDLLDDLLWPKLLRAGALALRPSRLGLAFFTLVAAWFVGSLSNLWSSSEQSFVEAAVALKLRGFGLIFSGLSALNGEAVLSGFSVLLYDLPRTLWDQHALALVLLTIPYVVIMAIGGGAISRSVACEFSQGVVMSWPEALAFAVKRWASLAGSLLAPWMGVALLALVMAIGGFFVLQGVPVLNLLGGLLYGLFLVLGTLAVLLFAGYLLGSSMLVPAVACEGTDAIDAVQRSLAYVAARPLRLILYLALLGVVGGVLVGVLGVLAQGVVSFTSTASTAFSGPIGTAIVTGGATEDGLTSTNAWARGMVATWSALPLLLVWAFALSYFWSAGTLLYLLMRQHCDGQDHAELWMPGMVEGTMARAMAERSVGNDQG